MKYGISKKHLTLIIDEIKKNLGKTYSPKLYIYGSRVKGGFRPYSDIDLLLKSENYDEKALVKIDFDSLDIPYKVDFVLEKNLYSKYRDEILSHCEVISLE